MAISDQNLTHLIWLLVITTLAVTWHSQHIKIQIVTLQKNMLQQRKEIEPLLSKQEKRKSVNEKRWSDVMDAMQAFSGKIHNKEQFLDTLKTQIKLRVLRAQKNATTMARDLLPKAEDLVIAEQTKKDSGTAEQRLIEDTKQSIKNIVRQSLDTGDFFNHNILIGY